VYSEADKDALHVARADEAVPIGPAPSAQSYLVADKIIAACRETGAEAVHPGYGFLSENEGFARALEQAGIDPAAVYVTNAVKHFSWEPRGKRRIHQTPRLSEIRACRPWLEAEIQAVTPAVIVCLGSTAAKALMGPEFRITQSRGQLLESPWAPALVATYHPSAVLRVDDPAQANQVYAALRDDLALAAEQARTAKR
jgi:uracil-DNA glycosylase family 4